MIVETFEQYSDEWWAARLGRPSASILSKIVTSTGKRSSSWKSMAFKLAAELERGKADDSFASKWMERGTVMEAEARKVFEFYSGIDIIEVGHVYRDESRICGVSPDGLSPDWEDALEIKCPSPGVHKQYCYEKRLPTTYKPQVFGGLWIADVVKRYHFFSYHPDMRPFHIVVTRESEGYKQYADALDKYIPLFVKDVARYAGG